MLKYIHCAFNANHRAAPVKKEFGQQADMSNPTPFPSSVPSTPPVDGGEAPVGVAKGGLSLPGQVGAVPEEVHALTAESSNLQQARCLNQYLGERAEQPTKKVVLTKRTKESMYLAFFFMRYLK